MATDAARVTIEDVAARAGVSIATVSRAVNGRYGVSARTIERVQVVIDELGYESSLIARSLRNHRTNVVGILVSGIEPFSAELLKGAARELQDTGFELIVYSGGMSGQEGWERRYLSRLGGTLADGIILVTPTVVQVATANRSWPSTRTSAVRNSRRWSPRTSKAPAPRCVTWSISDIAGSGSLPVDPTWSRRETGRRAIARRSPRPASSSTPTSSVSVGSPRRAPAFRRASCSRSPIGRTPCSPERTAAIQVPEPRPTRSVVPTTCRWSVRQNTRVGDRRSAATTRPFDPGDGPEGLVC